MSDTDFCPLIKKKCKKHNCKFYGNVIGNNPQTGQEVNQWDCMVVHIPMLLIENSQQQRGTGAAIESFRNEMVGANQNIARSLFEQLQNPSNALEHG